MEKQQDKSREMVSNSQRVGLFVTCLIDLFRPNVGFAAVKLLEQAGYSVEVPEQGCCGQVNFNGGDADGAQAMALSTIRLFAAFDYVVVPSCSCAAMIRVHYPELFPEGSEHAQEAERLAAKTWELTSFLHDVAGFSRVDAEFAGPVAVHDSCSGLRELGVRQQPRELLNKVTGLVEVPLKNPEVCCGFGGIFCVKYPDISNRIADKKLADIRSLEKPVAALVSTELGCLLHLSGKLHREGSSIRTLHVAEVLAGMADLDENLN